MGRRAKYDPATDTFIPASQTVEWGIYRDKGYSRRYGLTYDFYPRGTVVPESPTPVINVVDTPVSLTREELVEEIWREDMSRPIFEDNKLSCYEREVVAEQLLMFFPLINSDHRVISMNTDTPHKSQGRYQLTLPKSEMDIVRRDFLGQLQGEVVYGE